MKKHNLIKKTFYNMNVNSTKPRHTIATVSFGRAAVIYPHAFLADAT